MSRGDAVIALTLVFVIVAVSLIPNWHKITYRAGCFDSDGVSVCYVSGCRDFLCRHHALVPVTRSVYIRARVGSLCEFSAWNGHQYVTAMCK